MNRRDPFCSRAPWWSAVIAIALVAACGPKPCKKPVSVEAVLITDGRAAATIVIADQPSEAVQLAAAELTLYLEKSTGVRLPVVSESDIRPDGSQTLILLGASYFAAQRGFRNDDFDH